MSHKALLDTTGQWHHCQIPIIATTSFLSMVLCGERRTRSATSKKPAAQPTQVLHFVVNPLKPEKRVCCILGVDGRCKQ